MSKALPDPEELTYEEALEALEAIVQRAETGELPLEEAMTEHARGEALLKRCRVLLDDAEAQLRSFDQAATDASDEDSE